MRRLITTLTLASLLTGAAAAQQPGDQPSGGGIGMNIQGARERQNRKVEPPTLNLKSEEGAAWGMIATVLFAGGCLLAAIIPPKRGHQD